MSSPHREGGGPGRHARKNSHGEAPPHLSPMRPKHGVDSADMTLLVSRVDLYDAGRTENGPPKIPQALEDLPVVGSYRYAPDDPCPGAITVCRIPQKNTVVDNPHWMKINVVDKSKPCPYHANPSLLKYWNQRRRLFSQFDNGIELDDEGWFSVTPEQIASHVASNLSSLLQQQNPDKQQFVVLDCFTGCGGNAIQFALQPGVTVIGCDIDRTKLRKAANNAAIYGVPKNQLILLEVNCLFLLEFCYKDGLFTLDQPLETPEAAAKLMESMPPPAQTETVQGYQIGGIDLLPRNIDAIFMDPPWGGMDYEVFGKHGYDLEHNMKIARPRVSANSNCGSGAGDDFFDCFMADPRSKQERKAQFNLTVDETNCVNGVELLRMAAAATRCVLYDVPRNTNRGSLARAACKAGYRGNCKWEEHYLNSRLKTVTVYLGQDWSWAMEEEEVN